MAPSQNRDLLELERQIPICELFGDCSAHAAEPLALSKIVGGDPRRGTHDARILIVTQYPDVKSAVVRGEAYQGGTGTKIMRMFLHPDYLIGVDYPDYGRGSLRFFLDAQHIYMTSAVKCTIGGNPDQLGEKVVANCRRRFLERQLNVLDMVELILPMGRLAISSVFHVGLPDLDLASVIGRPSVGIRERDSIYARTVIALPHPSGLNRRFNPPVIVPGDSPAEARQKAAFARALGAVRRKLEEMGYSLRLLPERSDRGPLDRIP